MRTALREVFAAAAASYGRGNPLLLVEREETSALLPPMAGRYVLDLGAGPGHYASLAASSGAHLAVALDLTPEMLAGARQPAVVGDAARLPLRGECIDVLVMALLVSYVRDRADLFHEAARVLRPGGTLVLSDLHPEAGERGWRRSFEGPRGERLVVEATPASETELMAWLESAGLAVEVRCEARVDERLEPEFRRAGRRDFAELRGTPLLLLLRARKGVSHAR